MGQTKPPLSNTGATGLRLLSTAPYTRLTGHLRRPSPSPPSEPLRLDPPAALRTGAVTSHTAPLKPSPPHPQASRETPPLPQPMGDLAVPGTATHPHASPRPTRSGERGSRPRGGACEVGRVSPGRGPSHPIATELSGSLPRPAPVPAPASTGCASARRGRWCNRPLAAGCCVAPGAAGCGPPSCLPGTGSRP